MINYWEAQAGTILALNKLGYKNRYNERLDVFKLLTELDYLYNDGSFTQADIDKAKQAIDYLVRLRRLGLEPEAKNGIYV